MKVSGFTFIRNGESLGFPFVESIKSALPVVDEFIVVVGKSDDNTLQILKDFNHPKVRIIETTWNENMKTKGFVYGQQKMIGQFACTGEWAIYLEADEILHEDDHETLLASLKKHRHNPEVEALVFDYIHFYGNKNTYAWSPPFYRRAPRIIKTSVRSYAPDGLFWVVFDDDNKKGRYPKAALTNTMIYHYGCVRPDQQIRDKMTSVEVFWNKKNQAEGYSLGNIDHTTLHLFKGTHPKVMEGFHPEADGLFKVDTSFKLTRRDKKNHIGLKLEKLFGLDFSRKHFKLLKEEKRKAHLLSLL